MLRFFKNRLAKWLLEKQGFFTYFDAKVFCPVTSCLYQRVRAEGVFEREVCVPMQRIVKPNTWFFDVGANIGLMSIPILAKVPDVQVLSIEPSPNSFPYLEKTCNASSFKNRWRILSKVVSEGPGTTEFVLAQDENSAFEGMKDTGRVSMSDVVVLEKIPLDDIWVSLGSPPVSLIKIDVEGAESQVLKGAKLLIEKCRPNIVLEWCPTNLQAYEIPITWLLDFVNFNKYELYDIESLSPIKTAAHLEVLCIQRHESFLLVPLASSSAKN